MSAKMLPILIISFITGLLLVALSYATFILRPSIGASLLRELGIALTVAAIIGASVDSFFQKHLVSKTRDSAVEAAKELRKDLDTLRQKISDLFDETNSAAASLEERLRSNVEELGHRISQVGQEATSVLATVPIIASCIESGILNIYQCRSDHRAEERMIEALKRSQKKVDIIGISLRTFFQGGGMLNRAVNTLLQSSIQGRHLSTQWRVLVIDPICNQARLRSRREEMPSTDHEDGNLYREVNNTIEIVRNQYEEHGANVKLHIYSGTPACFILIVDDVLFVEQYHYGRVRGQRVAELVPLVEVKKDSKIYDELEGHFEYMWSELSQSPAKPKKT